MTGTMWRRDTEHGLMIINRRTEDAHCSEGHETHRVVVEPSRPVPRHDGMSDEWEQTGGAVIKAADECCAQCHGLSAGIEVER